MSNKLRWPGLVLAVSLITLLAGCKALKGPEIVGPAFTGDEIRKVIVGNTVQGPYGTEMFDYYYAGDGAVTGVVGAANDDSGTWLIKDNNIFCQDWDQFYGATQHCYEFYKSSRSGQYIMKNVDAYRVEDIEIWEVIQGNPYNM